MLVSEPTDYEVTIDAEEIEALQEARSVLCEIVKAMEKYGCSTLEGGYPECSINCYYEDIFNAKKLFNNLIDNTPYKMY